MTERHGFILAGTLVKFLAESTSGRWLPPQPRLDLRKPDGLGPCCPFGHGLALVRGACGARKRGHGSQVAGGSAALRDEERADVANSDGPVRRGLGRGGGPTSGWDEKREIEAARCWTTSTTSSATENRTDRSEPAGGEPGRTRRSSPGRSGCSHVSTAPQGRYRVLPSKSRSRLAYSWRAAVAVSGERPGVRVERPVEWARTGAAQQSASWPVRFAVADSLLDISRFLFIQRSSSCGQLSVSTRESAAY